MKNDIYLKEIKSIINNLLLFCENSRGNYFAFCGIQESIIKDLSSIGIPLKKSKNGIILNYLGNHIVFQKDLTENTDKIYRSPVFSDCNYNGLKTFNKPLKEFEILNIEDLYDDSISS